MFELNIKESVNTVDKDLKTLGIFIKDLTKKILLGVGSEMVKVVRKNNIYSKGVNKALYRVWDKDKQYVKVSVSGAKKRGGYINKIKANVLESGATKKPKRAKYLMFKTTDGKWIRTKQVTIKAKPFFVKSYESVISRMDNLIQNIANKLFKKEFK